MVTQNDMTSCYTKNYRQIKALNLRNLQESYFFQLTTKIKEAIITESNRRNKYFPHKIATVALHKCLKLQKCLGNDNDMVLVYMSHKFKLGMQILTRK